jgi:transposase
LFYFWYCFHIERKAYDTDCNDLEWEFVAPYLTLITTDAPQRTYELRKVFNGLRWIVRAGAAWRLLPHDLPPWSVVYQQTQRWIRAEVFTAMNHDLRQILRLLGGRARKPDRRHH